MSVRLLLTAAVFWTLLPLAAARAVIIFPKGGGAEIRGILVRESREAVVVRIPRPDGTYDQQVIGRDQIEDMIRTVSAERLAELRKDNPPGYRDYAEELAEKRKDPDARETALRLYHIAAYLDPAGLGRSCLLGMVALARTPAEERKFRAMVYLLDPEHDTRVLKKDVKRPVERPSGLTPGDAQELVESLQLMRRDLWRNALIAARRENVKTAFDYIKHILSYDEFIEMGERRRTLTPGELRRVLLAEASLIRVIGSTEELPDAKPAVGHVSWSRIMTTSPPTPVPSLSLETLTQYDPAKCEYRDNKWVKPE
jgi:hypothetical protein